MTRAKNTVTRAGNASPARCLALLSALLIAPLACQLSPSASGRESGAVDLGHDPERLDGFRADALYLPDDDLLGFVEIPAGPFLMGSDPAVDRLAYDNERWSPDRARGTVDLARFHLGRFEVTVAQYRAFVEATGAWVDPQALRSPPDHPVTHVSWPDALAYCRWLESALSESTATPPALARLLADGWRIHLPSEAQWEKAARGDDGRVFPWGERPRPDRANFASRSTTAVGSFPCPECPFGLSDLAGNVWELTRSRYLPYPWSPGPRVDDEDLLEDALFVMRGGGYGDGPQNVRAAVRGGVDPGARRPFLGFRLVLEHDSP